MVANNKVQEKWYALYTAPRAEKVIEQRLKQLGIETFLPTLKLMRKWSDRVKVVEMPMFSSYIFVKVKEAELFNLVKINGVVRVVFFSGSAAVIRECEIKAIKEFIKLSGEKCELLLGDEVEIISGVLFKGEELVIGKVEKIGKNYLSLFIEQLCARVIVKRCFVKKMM